MKRTATEQARILAKHLRQDPKTQNFLTAFAQDEVLQKRASALRYLGALWSTFLRSSQGQILLLSEGAKPRDAQDARMLQAIRSKLERGERLLPRERDLLEELTTPKAVTLPPEVLETVRGSLRQLAPLGRSNRDVRDLCGHMQQWLRKQGSR